ncbi:MAG: YaiI/YqxD family protein [Victivallaceae bacterium]|nr:YaiI/YqxD family protein [Victivallaceae bacterium]MDD4182030.1 YaiI/YqxD family protein [Victivallaceae bacterium]
MKIYSDTDALPVPLRDVLFKVAEREKIIILFVAAYAPRFTESTYVKCIAAGNDFDAADNWIVEQVATGDLVITADILLADRCLSLGAEVLNLKGEFFTSANIKNALAMRDIMADLRAGGEAVGGPAPFSDKHREKFTNALNRFLQRKR